jgi:hypothetical protein
MSLIRGALSVGTGKQSLVLRQRERSMLFSDGRGELALPQHVDQDVSNLGANLVSSRGGKSIAIHLGSDAGFVGLLASVDHVFCEYAILRLILKPA